MTIQRFKRIEDRAVDQVIAAQEGLGGGWWRSSPTARCRASWNTEWSAAAYSDPFEMFADAAEAGR